jgi:branched-chain amino acid transport system ATP-binding protein
VPPGTPALLRLDGLCKRFGAVTVADHIDLAVAPGEALGVIGPNGAGKSSMFNLISGNLMPSAGRIVFDGHDIGTLSPPARARRGIGRTYQIPQPFAHMTVFENLLVCGAFATGQPESQVHDHCAQVLHDTGLLAKANRPASALTLLERKRLELARALAGRPRLLLLDEIAGGLTEREAQALVATIQAIHAAGTTLIWIEHVVHALLSVASRLVVINFGALLTQGEPQAVMASDDVRRIYLGLEAA